MSDHRELEQSLLTIISIRTHASWLTLLLLRRCKSHRPGFLLPRGIIRPVEHDVEPERAFSEAGRENSLDVVVHNNKAKVGLKQCHDRETKVGKLSVRL